MSEIAETVLPILRGVRQMLVPAWGNVGHIEHKDGDPHDEVTVLDRQVELFLREKICAALPGVAFVGEEYGGDRTASRLCLVDPIDGTRHLIRGLPFCTTMAAFVEDGVVHFAAIYDFLNDVVYHAERGRGAFANERRIAVSDQPATSGILCFETQDKHIERALLDFAPTMKFLCAGYEYVLIATGKADGRVNVEPYGNDYDYVPGVLLVKEAGGVIANIGTRSYDYRNLDCIAATPAMFAALTEGPNALFPVP